ncbi:MAG: Sec61p translocation complex subunit [Phylliscum demangeonii]|nr:MAG: Sec61p translocation complex subunit [Phylliscum demangeonii]
MSEQLKEIADIPRDFLRDGTLFLNRCTKRKPAAWLDANRADDRLTQSRSQADKREFIKISQAVGVGFVIMGTIGYFVKLIHIPVNNILVGGS